VTPVPRPRREFWIAAGENLRIALQAMRANKLRFFLTVLGNVVAVMSVIAVVAVIDGLNRYIREQVAQESLRVFLIDKFGFVTNEEEYREALKRRDLTLFDAEALRDRMRLAEVVVAQSDATKSVRAGRVELKNVRIVGTTEGYDRTDKMELDQGRHLDASDVEHRRGVCVLGSDIAQQLFPRVDPIGRFARVAGHDVRVVGTLAPRGSILGQSQDNVVYTTMGQFQRMFGARRSLSIYVRVPAEVDLDRAQDEARVVLRSFRHVPLGKPDDFGFQTSDMLMGFWRNATGFIFIGTVALVGLSLLVGGIVIMNIMLVSVTERTREIGLRKSLGARRADIVSQFLSESIAYALAGGVLGVLAGMAVAVLVRMAFGFPATIQPWSVIVSLTVASAVGLFCGVYPAVRASRLDPVVALRQE
jgi:putative ABC transport system permease protein